MKIIIHYPSDVAPGPCGLRAEHFRHYERRKLIVDEDLLDSLVDVVNMGLAAELPMALQPYLCGGTLVPLAKQNNNNRSTTPRGQRIPACGDI